MSMKLVKKTAEYSIYKRSDDRYAVRDANKQPINGDEKVKILVAEDLLKIALPAAPVEEPAEEAAAEEAPAEEAAAEEAAAEEAAAEEAVTEEADAEEAAEEPSAAAEDDTAEDADKKE